MLSSACPCLLPLPSARSSLFLSSCRLNLSVYSNTFLPHDLLEPLSPPRFPSHFPLNILPADDSSVIIYFCVETSIFLLSLCIESKIISPVVTIYVNFTLHLYKHIRRSIIHYPYKSRVWFVVVVFIPLTRCMLETKLPAISIVTQDKNKILLSLPNDLFMTQKLERVCLRKGYPGLVSYITQSGQPQSLRHVSTPCLPSCSPLFFPSSLSSSGWPC